MKKPTWIIFDIGGVLLDWPTSSQAVADYLGVSKIMLFDTLFDQNVPMSIGAKMNVGELTTDEGWKMVLSSLGKEECTTQDILTQWCAQDFWYKDTLALLRELKDADYKLAVMSNSWLGLTDPNMKVVFPAELGLFDHIFDSSVEKLKKPDPAFYEHVENKIKDSSDNLFFIDDDKKNIVAGQDRGWQTFLYDATDDDGLSANKKVREILLS